MRTGDATGEGAVNGGDLAKWRAQFGLSHLAEAAAWSVPEPSSWQLTAVTCSLIYSWRPFRGVRRTKPLAFKRRASATGN